jgi:hypothetical protein
MQSFLFNFVQKDHPADEMPLVHLPDNPYSA